MQSRPGNYWTPVWDCHQAKEVWTLADLHFEKKKGLDTEISWTSCGTCSSTSMSASRLLSSPSRRRDAFGLIGTKLGLESPASHPVTSWYVLELSLESTSLLTNGPPSSKKMLTFGGPHLIFHGIRQTWMLLSFQVLA